MGQQNRLDRSGITLVAVLLGLALVSVVAATVITVGLIEYQTSRDYLSATKARLVADAGVTHAVAVVGGPLASRTFDDILVGADGSGTGNGAVCGDSPSQTSGTLLTDYQCTIAGSEEDNCRALLAECQVLSAGSGDYRELGCSQFEIDQPIVQSYDWQCIDDGGDDGILAGFPELDSSDELAQEGVDYGDGSYTLRLVNDIEDPSGDPFLDTNHRVVGISRGTTRGGGEAVVKVMLEAPPYPAVVVNGDLGVYSQATIAGACAGVHANGRLTVQQTVQIDGPISADTVVHWYYDQTEIEKIQQGVAPIDVPHLDPNDYCPDADFILRNGWKINMTATPDSVQVGGATDWGYNAAANEYKLGGHTSDLGTFCVYGNVSYTASMGTDTEPVPVTLIATGTVSLGGRSRISPAHPDGLMIVAGGDISIGGQAGARYSGLIYTENQCYFGGSATVEALVLCYDAPDSWSAEIGDMFDINQVGSSVSVTYDCSGPRQSPRVAAWWE